jgi:MinD-like ATPase involved in chromosome partitioning or flagellar assembly
MTSSVLVIVSGDTLTTEMEVDDAVPVSGLLPQWAHRCSSRPFEEIVLYGADNTTVLDPGLTLAELGLGYGAVIRLAGRDDERVRPSPAPPPASGPTAGTPEEPARWPPPDILLSPPPPVPSPAPTDLDHPSRGARPHGSHFEEGHLPAQVPAPRRLWVAVRAAATRSSTPAPTTGTFAKPTKTTARQRFRAALLASNRSHHLETMIRTAPLRRCVVIAVVSPKGGPGKTTVTALLGTLLAELRRDPVVALDANPDLGDLKDKLSDKGPAALVDDLAEWLDGHPNATPAELWARLGVGPHGLRYIATPRPPECSKERMIDAADFDLYATLITRMRDYAGVILVDCGTGLLDPPVRAALAAADQIVLITDSSATTARQVVAATGLLPPSTPTWLVANKMPRKGSMLDLGQVVAALPLLEGVTVIPLPSGGKLAENIVTPQFTWSDAPPEWQEPIRELAARLAHAWPPTPSDLAPGVGP